jgi:hypothetical protein
MARKRSKSNRSKGERLGWTPLDKVEHITLSSITVHGRKLSVHRNIEQRSGDATAQQYLIPLSFIHTDTRLNLYSAVDAVMLLHNFSH